MKARIKPLVIVALLIATMANSASASSRTMSLTYSPIEALFGAHTLQFQYKPNDFMSLHTQAGIYNSLWSIKPEFNNQPGTWFEFWLGAKVFAIGNAMDKGMYFASSFFLMYAKTPDGNVITVPYTAGPDQFAMGTRFAIGYEFVTDFGLILDLSAGLMGYVGWSFPSSGSYALNFMHPYAVGRVGYAW